MLWRVIYNVIIIPLMYLYFRISALFNPKFRAGIAGRKELFASLEAQLTQTRNLPKTVWFHFTSVGEFEQAKPLIEALKDEAKIVLTYFSPSVRMNVEKYPHTDVRCYLPFDTHRNATRMMRLIQPSALIFSKFDIWPNHVWAAAKNGVPIILIAGTLHAKSKRLLPIVRSFFKRVHEHITAHCVISESDARRFRQICPADAKIIVTGDTRFDQVYQRAKSVKIDEEIFPGQSSFGRPIIVAGSTYLEDETVLLDAYVLLRQRCTSIAPRLILVPHEPTLERIAEIETQLSNMNIPTVYLSRLSSDANLSDIDILVIDAVGLLAKLYLLGDFAFVGGSFHGSVHNVMEPAAMGKAVVFGPTIHNSHEAMLLQKRGAAMLVKNAQEVADAFEQLLTNPDNASERGRIAEQVILENLGASEKTLAIVRQILL
ncbi:MAG: 3-deoxy-D-manno-octulosonic acid transferase [Candidatus Poribacteria bacterium]